MKNIKRVLLCAIIAFLIGVSYMNPAYAEDLNNSPETALELHDGDIIQTSIDYDDKQVWYKVSLDEKSSIVSTLYSSDVVNYTIYDESMTSIYNDTFANNRNYALKCPAGDYYIQISGFGFVPTSISEITLQFNILRPDAYEDNDTIEKAMQIVPGQTLSGIKIEAENDVDWFEININKTCSIVSNISSNDRIKYALYDESMQQLDSISISSSSKVHAWKVDPGDYYLQIAEDSFAGMGVPNYLDNNTSMEIMLNDEDIYCYCHLIMSGDRRCNLAKG